MKKAEVKSFGKPDEVRAFPKGQNTDEVLTWLCENAQPAAAGDAPQTALP